MLASFIIDDNFSPVIISTIILHPLLYVTSKLNDDNFNDKGLYVDLRKIKSTNHVKCDLAEEIY